jgi:hypothetical protein
MRVIYAVSAIFLGILYTLHATASGRISLDLKRSSISTAKNRLNDTVSGEGNRSFCTDQIQDKERAPAFETSFGFLKPFGSHVRSVFHCSEYTHITSHIDTRSDSHRYTCVLCRHHEAEDHASEQMQILASAFQFVTYF